MHGGVLIGLALALACSVGTNLGGLWKQKGVVHIGEVEIRRPVQSFLALFRSKWFLIGWLVAAGGWVLHSGALALAPISLAQAVIAGSLVLLGVIAEKFFGFKLSRRQWVGLVVMSVGIVGLTLTTSSEGNSKNFGVIALSAFEGVLLLAGLAFGMSHKIDKLRGQHGVMLGLTSGILFGLSDLSIKAVTSGTHGLLGLFGPWTLFGVIAAVAAFFTSARSLQVGEPVAVIAATGAAANAIGIAGGIVVFGDPLGHGIELVARLGGFALTVVALALMPAPVRAEEEIRENEEEKLAEESTAEEGQRERAPAATEREPAVQPAIS